MTKNKEPVLVEEDGGHHLFLSEHEYWEIFREFVGRDERTRAIAYEDQSSALKAVYNRAYMQCYPFNVIDASASMRDLVVDYCELCGDPVHPDDDVADNKVHVSCEDEQ